MWLVNNVLFYFTANNAFHFDGKIMKIHSLIARVNAILSHICIKLFSYYLFSHQSTKITSAQIFAIVIILLHP
jgi:hypothetical protein